MKPPRGSIPDPLAAIRARFVPTEDLKFSFTVDDAAIAAWHARLGPHGLYPRELASALTDGTGFAREFRFTRFDPITGELRLETTGFDAGTRAFFSGRELDFVNGVIHLEKTDVTEGYKGASTGSILLGNAYRLARQLRFGGLELLASMQGTYVWARAGFLVTKRTWEDERPGGRLRGPVVERLWGISPMELPPLERDILIRLMERDDPRMLWDLVDLPRKVTSTEPPNNRVKIGWSLLAETQASWYGRLPFGEADAVERLEGYLRDKGLA
jgi:hypothetical protein